jgi:ribose transport system substrate-binding protein
MTRRTLLAGIAAGLSLALVGCGPAPAPSASNEPGGQAPGTEKKLRIGVSIPAATHGWTGGVVWWAEESKKKHSNVEFVISTAKDAAEQAKQIETMAAQGLDGLVVLASEAASVTPAVKQAKNAGMYVVSVDRGLTEPIADVFLRGDNAGFGRTAGEFMREKLGGKGNVLVLQGMNVPINGERVKGFEEALAGSDIKILESVPADWNREKAYKTIQTLLIKHPQVDAIWAADDDMALGAEKAVAEAGRTGIWIVGGGGMKDVIKRVMDGDATFPATVTYSPKMVADGIDRIIADLTAGKKPGTTQEDVVLPVVLVKPDNAKDHYYPESVY